MTFYSDLFMSLDRELCVSMTTLSMAKNESAAVRYSGHVVQVGALRKLQVYRRTVNYGFYKNLNAFSKLESCNYGNNYNRVVGVWNVYDGSSTWDECTYTYLVCKKSCLLQASEKTS